MQGAPPRTRFVAAVAAVLGPVLVSWALVAAVGSFTDAKERQAAENAGRVVNARVSSLGARETIDRILENHDPEVVLLGPSYANTDADPDALAARLGVSRSQVVLLSIPNSVGAHWYAILKHRVYANGHRPRLVVLISGLQSMLLDTPLTDASMLNLTVHLDEPDPVIDAKMSNSRALAFARLAEKRDKLRSALFGLARDLPPLLLLRSPSRPGIGMRPFETRAALDRVFDDARLDLSLHERGSPVVDVGRVVRAYDPSMLPSPSDSFMPEITSLVRDHGGRVVWVRPPMSPDIPADLDDVVLPGVQEEAIRLVDERGGAFVDMRGLPMSSDMFRNDDHMNEEGSRRFTEALAKALVDLEARHPDKGPDLLGDLRVTATRSGERGAPLPAAEAGWEGGGRWVEPGSTLRFLVEPSWDPLRGPLVVHLLAEQLHPVGAAPALGVRGEQLPVDRIAGTGTWTRWRARREAGPGADPFEISLAVPSDAPWTRVVGLALGEGSGRVALVGDLDALDGPRARLFGVFRTVDGVLVDETLHPEYLTPPGKVPGAAREVTDAPGRLGRYDTHRWDFLSDEYLIGETNFGSRCSPLRITEDGALLPLANVPCVEVQRRGMGRTCHTPDAIYFASSDGSDPLTNGRAYRLVLDEGRRCDGAVWLYPRDAFRIAFPREALASFRRGADTLVFGARYLQKRPALVTVRLSVDGEPWLETEVNGLELKKGPKAWALERPVPVGAREVLLEVTNQELTFYLVYQADLVEGVEATAEVGSPAGPGSR